MSAIGLTRFSLIDLSKVFDNPSHPVLFLLNLNQFANKIFSYEFKGQIFIILI